MNRLFVTLAAAGAGIGQHWFGVIVIAAIAAASGWVLGRQQDGRVTDVEKRTPSNHASSADPSHLVGLSPEVARSPEKAGNARCIECEEHSQASDEALSRIDPEDLATAFAEGTDSERYAALTTALQQDIQLPPDLLVDAYTNDASDEVRLLAFGTYIDSISDDREVVRAALESATNNTSAIVQAEAYRRLTELKNYEQAMGTAAELQDAMTD